MLFPYFVYSAHLTKFTIGKLFVYGNIFDFVKATGNGGAPRWRPDFDLRSRRQTKIGKISAQPHTIVKQICFPQHDLETEITIIVISKLAPNLWI